MRWWKYLRISRPIQWMESLLIVRDFFPIAVGLILAIVGTVVSMLEQMPISFVIFLAPVGFLGGVGVVQTMRKYRIFQLLAHPAHYHAVLCDTDIINIESEESSWIVQAESQDGPSRTPTFIRERSSELGFKRVLRVKPNGRYFADYPLEFSISKLPVLQIICKEIGNNPMLYVGFETEQSKGNEFPGAWWRIVTGTSAVEYYASQRTWVISVVPQKRIDGWHILEINLPEYVQETFGRSDMKPIRLSRFRFRGEYSFARVCFCGDR